MKDELFAAISHKFEDTHNFENFIQYALEEYSMFNTTESNLTRLLNLKKKPSERYSLFGERIIELGAACEVNKLTGDMLLTSLILSQGKVAELEGAKNNRADGTPSNLKDATPRQLVTAVARFEHVKYA